MKRLLVFELRKLGDAILSLPFILGASRRYEVFVCCHPSTVPVFESRLPRERILPWIAPWRTLPGERQGLKEGIQWVRRVQALHPDIAVCGWADARVEWLMRLSGAARRIGFPMTPLNYYAWRVPWRSRHLRYGRWLSFAGNCLTGGKLLNERLSRKDEHQAHLDDWQQVAEALGDSLDTTFPWLSAGRISDPVMSGWLNQTQRPIWAIHPGAGADVKRWAPDRFVQVIERFFCANHVPVVVLHAPGETPLAIEGAEVRHYSPRTFTDLIALTGQIDAVLCNDSAMSHLAAALGKPVVSIFGPSDPGPFAPYRNQKNMVIKSVCAFRPCMDRCLMPSPVCMHAIQVEAVMEKIQSVQLQMVHGGHDGNG